MKINEVIVVEGKNDSLHLKEFFEVDTIITHGLNLNKETIEFIREVNNTRGVILLLDPDRPGEVIRKRINDKIPGLKNAFLFKEEARTSKKVGVEHASRGVIEKALKNYITYSDNNDSISNGDMLELGLIGDEKKRDYLAYHYNLGKCNAKTLRKRLNMLNIRYEDIKRALDGYNSES